MTQLLPRFIHPPQGVPTVTKAQERRDQHSYCARGGKQRHPTESDALEALRRVRVARAKTENAEKRLPENRIYPCDDCGGWHLTSQEMHPEDLTPVKERVPSETWERYARRLEKRIAQQRAEILSLHAVGHGAANNRASRRRIESLVIALGRMTERWENERRHRIELVARLEQAEGGTKRFRLPRRRTG